MSLKISLWCANFVLCLLLPTTAFSQNVEPNQPETGFQREAVIEQLGLRPPRHGGVYVVAHRGAHRGIPENSLPAYRHAIELGVDFVEVDIRLTKDGVPISMHNDSIDAYVEGVKGHVADFTLAELRKLDIGAKHGEKWRGTKIPTFVEILDLCHGKCGVYLDLKRSP